ncbi:MAG: hypothetical protein SFY81_04025 [Verrucomicrobiota bacterium]|nr:hypothetical protein [Verrucomicrobiota bacterium]
MAWKPSSMAGLPALLIGMEMALTIIGLFKEEGHGGYRQGILRLAIARAPVDQ